MGRLYLRGLTIAILFLIVVLFVVFSSINVRRVTDLPNGLGMKERKSDASPIDTARVMKESETVKTPRAPVTRKHIINMTEDELLFKTEAPRNPIPVYIVEEHHEVAPYWFHATGDGRIPKYGNVLIHIDGHSDFVVPTFPRGDPVFTFPRKKSDILNLMTSNDAFIWSSAYSGFFSRVIWIYPSWDKEQLERGDYSQEIQSFGFIAGKNHEDSHSLCACFKDIQPTEPMYCEEVVDHEESPHLNISDCDIKHTVVTEVLSDRYAASLVKSTDWITSLDNIIFDIDEDYYGCEAAINKISESKLPETVLDHQLAPCIQKLFCPENAQHEAGFDEIHYQLLKKVATLKTLTDDDKQKLTSATLKDITRRNLEKYLCELDSFEDELEKYIRHLFGLNTQQIQAVADTGICLSCSPQTSDFDASNGMNYCIGYNRPGDTKVLFFTPSRDQIRRRTIELQTIFKNLPDPRIVTICRSSRDGYVPRKYMRTIENDIQNSLMKIFSGITRDSFHYDANLLGGTSGWYGRHGNKTW